VTHVVVTCMIIFVVCFFLVSRTCVCLDAYLVVVLFNGAMMLYYYVLDVCV